jgi:dolichol-phosphate mannosyltransferase
MVVLVFYWRFFTNAPLVGYTLIISAFLFISSVQLLTIGIMGEYVGRVYDEVKSRPHYVVKDGSIALVSRSSSSPVDEVSRREFVEAEIGELR